MLKGSSFLITLAIFIQAQSKEILNIYARGGSEARVVYPNGDDHYEEKYPEIDQEIQKHDPYHFGYDIKDHMNNFHWHREQSDEDGTKKGTYGYKNDKGLYRQVQYIADHNGFRVDIKTNEPGMANISPASVSIQAEHPPPPPPPPTHPPSPPPPKPTQTEQPEQAYPKETRLHLPLYAIRPMYHADYS